MNTEDLGRFRELGVATVYEAAGRQGLIDLPLIQIQPCSKVAGAARTVLCGQDDNLMVHAIVEQILPGEVVVIAMPEPRPIALIGELLTMQIKQRGAAAILLDAAIRDVEGLIQMGLPIWTHFIRAKGATKNIVGELNGVVTIGDTQINCGDIVVLDADGGVCVKQELAEKVLQESINRFDREFSMRERFLKGEISFDIHGLRDRVEGKGRL